MNRAEHYAEAERLLDTAFNDATGGFEADAQFAVMAAQVHATLAAADVDLDRQQAITEDWRAGSTRMPAPTNRPRPGTQKYEPCYCGDPTSTRPHPGQPDHPDFVPEGGTPRFPTAGPGQ